MHLLEYCGNTVRSPLQPMLRRRPQRTRPKRSSTSISSPPTGGVTDHAYARRPGPQDRRLPYPPDVVPGPRRAAIRRGGAGLQADQAQVVRRAGLHRPARPALLRFQAGGRTGRSRNRPTRSSSSGCRRRRPASGCRTRSSPTTSSSTRRSWRGGPRSTRTSRTASSSSIYCVKELGLRGLKLGPVYQHFDPQDRKHWPLFAKVRRSSSLPIMWHQGTTFPSRARLKWGLPLQLEDIAMDFPDLKMIIAHLGHPWEEDLRRADPQVPERLHRHLGGALPPVALLAGDGDGDGVRRRPTRSCSPRISPPARSPTSSTACATSTSRSRGRGCRKIPTEIQDQIIYENWKASSRSGRERAMGDRRRARAKGKGPKAIVVTMRTPDASMNQEYCALCVLPLLRARQEWKLSDMATTTHLVTAEELLADIQRRQRFELGKGWCKRCRRPASGRGEIALEISSTARLWLL